MFLCVHNACDITAYPYLQAFWCYALLHVPDSWPDLLQLCVLVSFEDGLQLVKLRGESMQAAADTKPSAMVSVIGLSSEKVCTSHSNMTQKCLGFYLSVQSFPNSTLQHFTQGSEA